jgi:hypothetical protein
MTEATVIIILCLICIGQGGFIMYLMSQVEQRNGYAKRLQREIDAMATEKKVLQTKLQRK